MIGLNKNELGISHWTDVLLIIITAVSLGSFYPAMWDVFLIGKVSVVYQLLYLFLWFLLIVVFNNKRSYKSIDKNFFLIIVAIISFYIIHSVIYQDNYEAVVTYVEIIIVIFLANNTFDRSKKFMSILIAVHCVMILAMVLGTILFYLNLIHPIGNDVILEKDSARVINYGLFYWKTSMDWDELIMRPSGYYDEPGSLALVTFLLLAYNKLHLNNKWFEIILLFGCLFTLSAAYFATFIAYILFFFLFTKNKRNTFLIAIPLIIALICFYFYVSEDSIIGGIQDASFGRAERIIEGTDQSRNYDISKKAFLHYFPYGASMEQIDREFPDATHETIWFFMARYGLIGTIILFFPVIYLLSKNISKGFFSDNMKLLYILVFQLVQRPNIHIPLYFLIIYFTWFNKDRKQCQQY